MRSRALLLAVGLIALIICGWFAVHSFLAKAHPEEERALTIGPPADLLEQAAAERIEAGIAALNDRTRPPAERLRAYRAGLTTAENLLVRSLRANPARARALASLAAVRWELRSPLSEEDADELLNIIATASRMADESPRTQLQLGEVLLKMGRTDDALTYLFRAVELDGGMSRQAIGILRDRNLRAAEILTALPLKTDVLTAIWRPFFEDGDGLNYLESVESAMSGSHSLLSRELLVTYGTACLRNRAPGRLLETMTRLGAIGDDAIDAARLHQISRAHLKLGDPLRAVGVAREAIAKEPEAAYLHVQFGDATMAAGDFEATVGAFRSALGVLARSGGSPLARATLYRKIGQAEEGRGEMGRAYDAYRMALELNPDEPRAGRRLREMQEAAGLGPS